MGQGQSLQSASLPSREEILKRTENGREIIREIFSWMVYRADIKEFYALANPDQCSRYIFVTANALDTLFKKIELEPQEGPKGAIYLQKSSKLTNPEDPRQKQARSVLCLKLAFFYVRIFQIFAALSLSIFDSDTSKGKIIDALQELKDYDNIPLMPRQQRGGAIPAEFQYFKSILQDVGNDIYAINLGRMPLFIEFKDEKNASFMFELISESLGNLKIEVLGDMVVKPLRRDYKEIELTFKNIRDASDNKLITLYGTSIAKTFRLQYSESDKEYKTIDDDGLEGESGVIYQKLFLDKIYEAMRIKYGRGKDKDSEERDYESRGFKRRDYSDREKNYSYSASDRAEYLARRNPQFREFKDSTKSVKEGLHTKLLLEAFAQAPKAHCIARSLQLLSEAGLRSKIPEAIYSDICKTKFMTETKSLPPANEAIHKEIGIYGLAQLFYDTIENATPVISSQTKVQQELFKKKMMIAFEEKKKEEVEKLKEIRFDLIKNKLPKEVCEGKALDRSLQITNQDLIRKLRDTVRKMINQQISHTANVVLLLKQLFLLPVRQGGRLEIHPNVRRLGMPEVNRIAQLARNLLTEYYENCEIYYRIGVAQINRNKSLTTVV